VKPRLEPARAARRRLEKLDWKRLDADVRVRNSGCRAGAAGKGDLATGSATAPNTRTERGRVAASAEPSTTR